ncbi:unnamed protein product [Victoria cruziana]
MESSPPSSPRSFPASPHLLQHSIAFSTKFLVAEGRRAVTYPFWNLVSPHHAGQSPTWCAGGVGRELESPRGHFPPPFVMYASLDVNLWATPRRTPAERGQLLSSEICCRNR